MSRADRRNTNKPKLSMVDLTCLESCAEVLEFGAKKYARDNWRKGMPVTEIIDSLLRHLGALQRGELIDPESGLSHIGHIQCNALFLGNRANKDDLPIDIGEDEAAMSIRPPTEEDGITEGRWGIEDDDWFPIIGLNLVNRDEPVSMEDYEAFVYQKKQKAKKKACAENTCMDCNTPKSTFDRFNLNESTKGEPVPTFDRFRDGASNNKNPFTPLCAGNEYDDIEHF